jgi:hypothetical protein
MAAWQAGRDLVAHDATIPASREIVDRYLVVNGVGIHDLVGDVAGWGG